MSLILKDEPQDKLPPIEAGLTQAVCYGVIDIGTQPGFKDFPSRRKVILQFEVPSSRIEVDGKDLPRAISDTFTMSMFKNAKLRKTLACWRGRDFNKEELEGFDLKKLLGVNAMLNIVHNESTQPGNNNVYANISAINPMPKSMPNLAAENPLKFFEFPEEGQPVVIDPELPEWIRKKIEDSTEYAKGNGTHEELRDPDDASAITDPDLMDDSEPPF